MNEPGITGASVSGGDRLLGEPEEFGFILRPTVARVRVGEAFGARKACRWTTEARRTKHELLPSFPGSSSSPRLARRSETTRNSCAFHHTTTPINQYGRKATDLSKIFRQPRHNCKIRVWRHLSGAPNGAQRFLKETALRQRIVGGEMIAAA
jgi:hypothetical protein